MGGHILLSLTLLMCVCAYVWQKSKFDDFIFSAMCLKGNITETFEYVSLKVRRTRMTGIQVWWVCQTHPVHSQIHSSPSPVLLCITSGLTTASPVSHVGFGCWQTLVRVGKARVEEHGYFCPPTIALNRSLAVMEYPLWLQLAPHSLAVIPASLW